MLAGSAGRSRLKWKVTRITVVGITQQCPCRWASSTAREPPAQAQPLFYSSREPDFPDRMKSVSRQLPRPQSHRRPGGDRLRPPQIGFKRGSDASRGKQDKKEREQNLQKESDSEAIGAGEVVSSEACADVRALASKDSLEPYLQRSKPPLQPSKPPLQRKVKDKKALFDEENRAAYLAERYMTQAELERLSGRLKYHEDNADALDAQVAYLTSLWKNRQESKRTPFLEEESEEYRGTRTEQVKQGTQGTSGDLAQNSTSQGHPSTARVTHPDIKLDDAVPSVVEEENGYVDLLQEWEEDEEMEALGFKIAPKRVITGLERRIARLEAEAKADKEKKKEGEAASERKEKKEVQAASETKGKQEEVTLVSVHVDLAGKEGLASARATDEPREEPKEIEFEPKEEPSSQPKETPAEEGGVILRGVQTASGDASKVQSRWARIGNIPFAALRADARSGIEEGDYKIAENEEEVRQESITAVELQAETVLEEVLQEGQDLNGRWYVSAPIDADQLLFHPHLIRKGRQGGMEAFEIVRRGISADLGLKELMDPDRLRIQCFCNLRGIIGFYFKSEIAPDHDVIWEFLDSFARAGPYVTFSMAGSKYQDADVKVKAHLYDHIANPDCTAVYLGGLGDTGYLEDLEYLGSRKKLQKLCLLSLSSEGKLVETYRKYSHLEAKWSKDVFVSQNELVFNGKIAWDSRQKKYLYLE